MLYNNFLTLIIKDPFSVISAYTLFNLILNPIIFVLVTSYFIKKEGISLMKSLLISLTVALVVIVGSRIVYVLLSWSYFKDFSVNPWELSARSFTMFGGFVLAFPLTYIISKIVKINFWRMLDILTPGWSLGIAFNKTGCLFNGCCFGIPTKSFFSISYPEGTSPYSYYFNDLINIVGESGNLSNSIPLHPVQFYEAMIGLLGFFISLILFKKKSKDGNIFMTFAITYSFARLVLNYLRATPYPMEDTQGLLPFLYFVIFIGTILIFIFRKKNIKN